MKFKYYLYILFFIFCGIQSVKSQIPTLSDSAQISLLTNSPWDKEIYALFGHTAIRVNDPISKLDVAFNYGIFDFDSPNFILRFIKGETDYFVGAIYFKSYLYEYESKGVGVTEQILNLNQTEKQKIFEALVINSLPENREYRYNYFYDNCSTRPRDIIENNINGQLIYKPTDLHQTYRDLIHQQLSTSIWVKFGIDIVIGADADKIITDKQKDFLPIYLEKSFENANVVNADTTSRPLVNETVQILKNNSYTVSNASNSFFTPLIVALLVLLISLIISIITFKRTFWLAKIYDFLLFFITGLCGCLIFFLMYFSVHPCTNPNWNIIWLNPLQLIFAILFWIKPLSKYTFYYHFINFAGLTLFLLAWFLTPQYLDLAFIPYILSLWIRSGTNILQYKRTKKQKVTL